MSKTLDLLHLAGVHGNADYFGTQPYLVCDAKPSALVGWTTAYWTDANGDQQSRDFSLSGPRPDNRTVREITTEQAWAYLVAECIIESDAEPRRGPFGGVGRSSFIGQRTAELAAQAKAQGLEPAPRVYEWLDYGICDADGGSYRGQVHVVLRADSVAQAARISGRTVGYLRANGRWTTAEEAIQAATGEQSGVLRGRRSDQGGAYHPVTIFV